VSADEGIKLTHRMRQANSAKEIYELSQDLARIAGKIKHLKATLFVLSDGVPAQDEMRLRQP